MLPDGRRVVSAGDKTLKVWDVVTGECVATLKGHSKEVRCGVRYLWYFCVDVCSSEVNCVPVFPDGRRVVSASRDKALKVWDVATGKCVATLEGHSDSVRCGVRCTFVMIWLRRRSRALPCFRTGGASFLVQ